MIYKIPEVAQEIQSFFGKLHEALAHQVTRMIEEQLEREVNAWLYHSWHQRRQSVKRNSKHIVRNVAVSKRVSFCETGIGSVNR
jgi:uncharacterized protein (DUF2267 family)